MAQNNRRGRSGRRRSGGNQGNNPNRSIDSQGPEVKIRGNAQQVYDKYTALARDAFSNGDRIRAESLQQHAEHYYRVLQAMKPPEQKDQNRQDGQQNNAQNGHDQSGQSGKDERDQGGQDAGSNGADQSGDNAERKPRRERKRREERAEPEVTEQREAAKAEEPSDRVAVEKVTVENEGGETSEAAEAAAREASGEEEAKPRRRRRTRRKTEDEGGEAKGDSASEEAPAA